MCARWPVRAQPTEEGRDGLAKEQDGSEVGERPKNPLRQATGRGNGLERKQDGGRGALSEGRPVVREPLRQSRGCGQALGGWRETTGPEPCNQEARH